jgi:prephenate dehydrogenase
MCESARVNVAVIGLGLIGGSLLRALDAAGHEVTGFDGASATRAQAVEAGFRVADGMAGAVNGAEIVVVAVPLPVLPDVLAGLAGHDSLITDVTSVKAPVLDLARKHGLARFVGGHPMAGKETSGFAAADPALFTGCMWVLGLEPETALDDWLTLAALYTELGARVVPATATEHDRAVAQVSHVPHLLAAVLARQLAGNPLAGALAAGSFRDGTRVAATRAELTAAMCGGNAAEVEHTLHTVLGDLHHLHDLLETPDPIAALIPPLAAASDLRRAWPPHPAGDVVEMPADAGRLLALGRAGGWVTEVAEDREIVKTKRPETDLNRP